MGLEERTQHAGPRPERPHARADWRQMLGVGAIASILGIAAGLLIDWFPVAASEEAKPIDTLWDVLIIFSVPVFVGVTVVVLFSVVEVPDASGRGEPRRPADPRQHAPRGHLDRDPRDHPRRPLHLRLRRPRGRRGRRRPTRCRCASSASSSPGRSSTSADGKEVASRQLHVPINRQVKFTLQSKDVLHDFWVPAFRMKKDAVPGIDVKYSVTPRLGRTRSSARSCAGSGTRSCARPPSSSSRRPSTKLARRARQAARAPAGGAAAARGRRQGDLHLPEATAPRATRSPTRARRARSGRTSTTCSRTRTRRSSRSRSSIPTR